MIENLRKECRARGLELPTFWLPRQAVPVKFTLIKPSKSGAPGGTRTPHLLVSSQWSKNAKCLFCVAWESAVNTLKSASEPEIPLTLELKERAGHDAPPQPPSTASNANRADAPAFLNIALCSLMLKHVLLVGHVDTVRRSRIGTCPRGSGRNYMGEKRSC